MYCWTTPNVIHSLDSLVYTLLILSYERTLTVTLEIVWKVLVTRYAERSLWKGSLTTMKDVPVARNSWRSRPSSGGLTFLLRAWTGVPGSTVTLLSWRKCVAQVLELTLRFSQYITPWVTSYLQAPISGRIILRQNYLSLFTYLRVILLK